MQAVPSFDNLLHSYFKIGLVVPDKQKCSTSVDCFRHGQTDGRMERLINCSTLCRLTVICKDTRDARGDNHFNYQFRVMRYHYCCYFNCRRLHIYPSSLFIKRKLRMNQTLTSASKIMQNSVPSAVGVMHPPPSLNINNFRAEHTQISQVHKSVVAFRRMKLALEHHANANHK